MAKKSRPQAVQYYLEVISGEPRIFEITRREAVVAGVDGWLFACSCGETDCKHIVHAMAKVLACGDPENFLADHVDVI